MEENEQFFRSVIEGLVVHQSGQGYGKCPLHEDKVKSFSVNVLTSQWYCHAGCGAGNAITLSRRLGLTPPSQVGSTSRANDISPAPHNAAPAAGSAGGERTATPAQPISKKVVARYVYHDESGGPLYRVNRTEPKGFFQERFENGQWISGTSGCRRVPYHLPKLLASESFVILVEGEKDVERLESLGFTSTTTSQGANAWQADYAPFFAKKKVVIIPDNDDPGRAYAHQAAKDIAAAGGFVKMTEIPGLPEHGDVSDFLDSGKFAPDLLALIKATPVYGTFQHSQETPAQYFERRGIWIMDGVGLLPTEYKPHAKESVQLIVKDLRNWSEKVQEKINLVDSLVISCRTKNTYAAILSLLKEAHELSFLEAK